MVHSNPGTDSTTMQPARLAALGQCTGHACTWLCHDDAFWCHKHAPSHCLTLLLLLQRERTQQVGAEHQHRLLALLQAQMRMNLLETHLLLKAISEHWS